MVVAEILSPDHPMKIRLEQFLNEVDYSNIEPASSQPLPI
jgi:hypothetical protein